jgi:hypothetical protein
MELILTQRSDYQVTVTCDHHPSHTFDLQPLRLLGHWYERRYCQVAERVDILTYW